VHFASLSFLILKHKHMPNWCTNRLQVTGDKHELNKFKEQTLVKSDNSDTIDFTMELLHPTPKELLEQTSPAMWRGEADDIEGKLAFENTLEELKQKYGHTDWYNWRVVNWGTKWDVAESCICDDEDEIFSVDYDTAWAPNNAWVNYIAKKFPTLEFRLSYEEPGMDFCGVYIVKGEYEELNESELEYIDPENNRQVYYDGEIEKYRYSDTNEIAGSEDDDFWPDMRNPFIN
jgi:hypothetical protein